jgi:flagellar protein FlbT
MGLRISLKPYERLIINGASIKNGSRNTDFLIESHCKFLRETEIIHESEADTPCKKLCVTLQVIYLSDNPDEAKDLFCKQAFEIISIMPSSASFMLDIQNELAESRFHKAIKIGRKLIAHEKELLALREANTRAA